MNGQKIGKNERDISFLEFFSDCCWIKLVVSPAKEQESSIFMTDNDSVVHVINKQTSRDPYLLSLIRKRVLICLGNNIM